MNSVLVDNLTKVIRVINDNPLRVNGHQAIRGTFELKALLPNMIPGVVIKMKSIFNKEQSVCFKVYTIEKPYNL